jgi:hypothetical protein
MFKLWDVQQICPQQITTAVCLVQNGILHRLYRLRPHQLDQQKGSRSERITNIERTLQKCTYAAACTSRIVSDTYMSAHLLIGKEFGGLPHGDSEECGLRKVLESPKTAVVQRNNWIIPLTSNPKPNYESYDSCRHT